MGGWTDQRRARPARPRQPKQLRAFADMSPRRSTRLLAKQTDARLVDLCRQGDERAFEAIVLRYRRELLGYCRRLGLSDSRSEDALQQALLKSWLALNGGTEVHDLRPWLRRIVHNTALNLGRSSQGNREIDLDSPLVDAAVADTAPELRAAARETLSRVAALPAMQRDAMLLSAIEGRSHEEVASALGISHVAVRGLLYRARSTLRAGAAALTPAPLVSWVIQTASRLATASSDVAGWAGGGGDFGIGKALLEVAAIAGTAAVAVGVVFGPFDTNRHSAPRASRSSASAISPTGVAIQTASGSPAEQSRTQVRSLASGGRASRGGGLRGTSVMNTSSTRRTRASEGAAPIAASPGEQPKSQPVTVPVAGSPIALDTGASADTNPGKPVSGAGREAPESAGAPKAAEPPVAEKEPHDGGSASEGSEREAEAAREQHEREAEAAREKREREAEATREASEREAEATREQHEREAELAREQREREAGR